MNCDRCENMLAALIEGDLSAQDASTVNAHVSGCESCRESLAGYRALEDELLLRRTLVPPAAPFLHGVFAPAVSPALHRARVLMDSIFSFPALAAFFFVVVGWMAFAYSDIVQGWVSQIAGATPTAGRFGNWMNEMATTYSGGDMLMVTLAYSLVTLLVIASGSWMTWRHVHCD